MKLMREIEDGKGENVKSIFERGWDALNPENQERHILYLRAVSRYSKTRRASKIDGYFILVNSDCDISIIPEIFHAKHEIEENYEY